MRKSLMRASAVWLLAGDAAFAPAHAAAQAPTPAPGFRDSVNVTLANLELWATSREGELITDLTPAEVVVRVKGRPRPITNFAFVDRNQAKLAHMPTGGAEATETAPVSPADTERTVLILYVDAERTAPADRQPILAAVSALVADTLRPPDRALVAADVGSFKVVSPLTGDPDVVTTAVARLLHEAGGLSGILMERRRFIGDLEHIAAQGRRAMEDPLTVARLYAAQREMDIRRAVTNFTGLIDAVSGLAGRKQLVWIGSGLPMSPGDEAAAIMEQFFPQMPLTRIDFSTSDCTHLFRDLSNAALAAGVTVHAMDARGLTSPMSLSAESPSMGSAATAFAEMHAVQQSLLFLAERTGGTALVNSNDFAGGLATMADHIDRYYSLAFAVEPDEVDVLAQVEVELRGRPGSRVFYRRAILPRSPVRRTADATLAALSFGPEDSSGRVQVETSRTGRKHKGAWIVPVTVHVPLRQLVLVPDGGVLRATVSIFVVVEDLDGRRSEVSRIQQRLEIKPQALDLVETIPLQAELAMRKGEHRLAVGLLDEIGGGTWFALVTAQGPDGVAPKANP